MKLLRPSSPTLLPSPLQLVLSMRDNCGGDMTCEKAVWDVNRTNLCQQISIFIACMCSHAMENIWGHVFRITHAYGEETPPDELFGVVRRSD